MEEIEKIPRLSPKEALILEMLIGNGEMFGLQMVRESEGLLKRGTVYVTLNRMEEKGFVTSWKEQRQPGEIGLPRRLYKVQRHGAMAFKAHIAWQQVVSDLALGLVGRFLTQ